MGTTDVQALDDLGDHNTLTRRPGIRGRPAPMAVDRLDWTGDPAAQENPNQSQVNPRPLAVGERSSLHKATDRHGFPCLVRRSLGPPAETFAADQRLGATFLDAVDIPEILRIDRDDVWMDSPAWSSGRVRPAAESVDGYVTGALRHLLEGGMLIGTGTVHVGPSGRLVCPDVVVASSVERDQRSLLCAIVAGLATLDAHLVADSLADLCGTRTPLAVSRAVACVRSLEVRWNAVAFGLALHGLSRAVINAGARGEPLVLLGEELLHRLDLSHAHGVTAVGLATPERVLALACGSKVPH